MPPLVTRLAVAGIFWFVAGLQVFAGQDSVAAALIPRPAKMTLASGEFPLTSTTIITTDRAHRDLARRLAHMLEPATGIEFGIDPSGRPAAAGIIIKVAPKYADLGEEGYRLEVRPHQVLIQAARSAGAFYAFETILQLLPAEIFRRAPVENVAWTIPCLAMEDRPRFSWRGGMLDVSRHFMPKRFILEYIDLLALHKMNRLHLHLCDDQGWRIEIKKYPKLTEIGAWRKETVIGHASKGRRQFDGVRHGGFYTQSDIREIVAYAARRHIMVVPEIEMPGHCQAALAAYPELGNTGEKLPVRTYWGVNANIYNVKEETIRFLQDVLSEVIALFPSPFIHIGGDEVPKEQWKKSVLAQARMKELGLQGEEELQSWFIGRMDSWLTRHGRRLIGWDEILEGGLAPGATVMSWRGNQGGIAAARSGHDVVMAPTHSTYFDYYQSRKPGEPLAIGGYLPLRKVYAFDPIPPELRPEEARHILGAQGQIWTEYIGGPRKAEYMAFPRMAALAEAVWTPPESRSYDDFLERLQVHLKRLQALDVNYRPLDPEPTRVGRWSSGETNEVFAQHEWDITRWLSRPGTVSITFRYIGGAHRLDIESAEILEDGCPIARDEHPGITGGVTRDNTYSVTVPRVRPGARYTLRARIRSDGGTDSNGELLMAYH